MAELIPKAESDMRCVISACLGFALGLSVLCVTLTAMRHPKDPSELIIKRGDYVYQKLTGVKGLVNQVNVDGTINVTWGNANGLYTNNFDAIGWEK